MTDLLPDSWFLNPVWHALQGPHAPLALRVGGACRYPPLVAPFAAIQEPTDHELDELRQLLAPGEAVWIAQYDRPVSTLEIVDALACVQMALPPQAPSPPTSGELEPLTSVHAREMVALTDLAFPGFFRPETYRMGYYCGIRVGGELVAMGGERLTLTGFPEVSGICTHPQHRGKGYATSIISHLVARHRAAGLRSWLHVSAPNTNAIDLYASLGFKRVRTLWLNRIVRTG